MVELLTSPLQFVFMALYSPLVVWSCMVSASEGSLIFFCGIISLGVIHLSMKLVEGGVKSTRMMVMLHVVNAGLFVMMWTSDVWQEAFPCVKTRVMGTNRIGSHGQNSKGYCG